VTGASLPGLEACAALVERSDPDRFRVAMAAPPAAREVLFPLYAFNLEVARAPWATREPMLAEMRLQWWRDQVEAAAVQLPPRPRGRGPPGHCSAQAASTPPRSTP
jgi:phytoene/squalene synthetase